MYGYVGSDKMSCSYNGERCPHTVIRKWNSLAWFSKWLPPFARRYRTNTRTANRLGRVEGGSGRFPNTVAALWAFRYTTVIKDLGSCLVRDTTASPSFAFIIIFSHFLNFKGITVIILIYVNAKMWRTRSTFCIFYLIYVPKKKHTKRDA